MKKILIISGVALALIALMIFNKMISKKGEVNVYTEVKKGSFEISVSNSGELLAERSLDIKGPQLAASNNQRGGDHGMRFMEMKIQDMVPEGTIVKEGDYIAQLDRSSYSNTLKDANDQLKTYQNNVSMKVLDTTVVLTTLRDEIKNQTYVVEEASITLDQSKYEPPAAIRQAEITLDKAQRTLNQKIKSYKLRVAQTLSEINHEKLHLNQQTQLVEDLQAYLAKFTITAPAPGMIIYKKEWGGAKRKTGSSVNPFDLVIATLPDLSSMISKVYVNEIEVSKIVKGQNCIINVDAFPEKKYSGTVSSVANIGEVLPNSDAKMFEVLIKLNGSDPDLRPSMTTGNKIIISTYEDVVYVPSECVNAGADSIPFVYGKNNKKNIVLLGESNEKNVIVEKGLEPGAMIYVIPPENTESFKFKGEELIPLLKERDKAKKTENEKYRR
jgi:HlyD family secretion protein